MNIYQKNRNAFINFLNRAW